MCNWEEHSHHIIIGSVPIEGFLDPSPIFGTLNFQCVSLCPCIHMPVSCQPPSVRMFLPICMHSQGVSSTPLVLVKD